MSRLRILEEIDLATSNREDHRAIMSCIYLPPSSSVHDKQQKEKQFQVDRASLQCPVKCAQFQCKLNSTFANYNVQHVSIDAMLDSCTSMIKDAAISVFDKPAQVPRQPWISQMTWQVLQYAAPLRRQQHKINQVRKRQMTLFWLLAWASTRKSLFVPHCIASVDDTYCAPNVGWVAVARMPGVNHVLTVLDNIAAIFHHSITLLHKAVKIFVAIDRVDSLQDMA